LALDKVQIYKAEGYEPEALATVSFKNPSLTLLAPTFK